MPSSASLTYDLRCKAFTSTGGVDDNPSQFERVSGFLTVQSGLAENSATIFGIRRFQGGGRDNPAVFRQCRQYLGALHEVR